RHAHRHTVGDPLVDPRAGLQRCGGAHGGSVSAADRPFVGGGRLSRPLLIRGGRLLDPAAGRDEVADLLLAEGLVAGIGGTPPRDVEVFEAAGLCVFPGFIDLHAHLREPGREYAETIATGLAAAAAGGFTAVCAWRETYTVHDSGAAAE